MHQQEVQALDEDEITEFRERTSAIRISYKISAQNQNNEYYLYLINYHLKDYPTTCLAGYPLEFLTLFIGGLLAS